jgi:hypothetical protein
MSNGLGKDLIVLVADKNMQATLESILQRHDALGIREIHFDVFPHLHRDPGCRLESHSFLRSFRDVYSYSIVVFDKQGCGSETSSRQELEKNVEDLLKSVGWENRSIAVVLDPELEIWVWNDSPHLSEILGWKQGNANLREWLVQKEYLAEGQVKPKMPKEAMEEVLRLARKPRSSSVYSQIASKVSFKNCVDPSFLKLKLTLQQWFSQSMNF